MRGWTFCADIVDGQGVGIFPIVIIDPYLGDIIEDTIKYFESSFEGTAGLAEEMMLTKPSSE